MARKPAGIDVDRNYVTVTLCIPLTSNERHTPSRLIIRAVNTTFSTATQFQLQLPIVVKFQEINLKFKKSEKVQDVINFDKV